MINGECHGGVAGGTGNFYEKNGVVIAAGPGGDERGIAAVILEEILDELIEQTMFPRHENSGALVFRFFQFLFEALDFPKTEFGVDRQSATDGGGLDGHQRPDIIVIAAIHFLSGIGSKHELRRAIFGEQDVGQGEGAIEAAAGELPETALGFFS